jgi:hypothetical protein
MPKTPTAAMIPGQGQRVFILAFRARGALTSKLSSATVLGFGLVTHGAYAEASLGSSICFRLRLAAVTGAGVLDAHAFPCAPTIYSLRCIPALIL